LAREERGDDERNAIGNEGAKDRTPSFARNPVGEDDIRPFYGVTPNPKKIKKLGVQELTFGMLGGLFFFEFLTTFYFGGP